MEDWILGPGSSDAAAKGSDEVRLRVDTSRPEVLFLALLTSVMSSKVDGGRTSFSSSAFPTPKALRDQLTASIRSSVRFQR